MEKYEVKKDCVLAVLKGSIVFVDDNQYKFAKDYLIPLTDKPIEKKKKTVKK